MAATATHVAVLPGSVAVMLFFHGDNSNRDEPMYPSRWKHPAYCIAGENSMGYGMTLAEAIRSSKFGRNNVVINSGKYHAM